MRNNKEQNRQHVVYQQEKEENQKLVSRLLVHSDSGLRVFTHTLLNKIHFPFKTNHIHPLKRVADIVMLVATKSKKKLVGTKFDVGTHHGRVHPNEFHRKGTDNELHFNGHSAINDFKDAGLGEAVE